jgi:ligand-binding sensor domain-containing protein
LYSGIVKLHDTTWTTYNSTNSGLPDNYIRCIVIDSAQTKWIGTSGGVAKLHDTVWTVYDINNSGMVNDNVNALAIDQAGNIWIGTNLGIAKFDGLNWTIYKTYNSGLPDNSVYALAVDHNNNLWIGTYSGLAMFDGTNWAVYDTSNSALPADIIITIVVDNNNDLWIGTYQGLVKMTLPTYIKPVASPDNFTIYPNPSSGNFTLLLTEKFNKAQLRIFDVYGKCVYQSQIINKESEIHTELPGGIYLYQVKDDKQLISSGKLIVQ